ncbi:right-handed parallel beta-helix repeat-containing protein, partial [Halorubrum sp. JWXQ-INN 858]|uniref:right-handed parallel beta-helix repeat-containing protein n=1 Tax=Halorubrum sp. JWXQ-INN 858 TaxID=2690782 RepID=UPI001F2A7C99
MCGTLLVAGAGGVAVVTADVENTTDRVGPSQFDTEAGDLLWEADEDISSDRPPIVVDGILVMTTGGIDSPDRVVAYDVGTGEERWAVDVAASGLTVVDGVVYAYASDPTAPTTTPGVWALDLELGTVEWHADFDARGGISVGDGTVHAVKHVNADTSRVTALDAETGDEEWAKETDAIRSGPTAVDGTVYVVNGGASSGMIAFDADTGTEQWQWEAEESIEIAKGPTVADGHVYVSHTAGDDEPGFVSAVDTADGETVWQAYLGVAQTALATVPTTPTVAAENNEPTVYVGYDGLYALDPTDGSERWSDDDAVFDAPTVADGTLFVPQTTDSGAFRALDPNDGTERWSVETGDRSEVIVVDGVAYVAVTTGDERLMAIDAGVTGSSSDSRVMLGGQHHQWTGEIPDVEPRVVGVEYDEGVFAEDELTVTATVRNDWDPTTSATYTLELDDDPQGSETTDVPAYGTNTVELSLTAPDESGEYTLAINGEEVGTLTVVDENDPVFRSAFLFSDTRLLEGDLIQITYDATNLGDEYVSESATLSLEGPAFDGREEVKSFDAEGPELGGTATYTLTSDSAEEPGKYTVYINDREIETIDVLSANEPIYLSDVNRLQDSIISGIEAPIDPSAAGEASVDVRYENLGETQDSVESELVASDGETEVASVTETIVVDGESSSTERLSVPLAEAGVYELEVDGQSVGEVEVLVDGVQDGDSIQAAIDAAQPGDTIIVGDGTYEESLTIDKPLTLRTVSERGAVLEGGDELERAITVTDDGVTVEGFQIEGYTADGFDAAVEAEGDRFTFRNNTVTNAVDAIEVASSNDIVIADNHIHDNGGDAIAFSSGVTDASVLRNTITDNGGDGLYLGNRNDRFTVDANEIRRNQGGITYNQNDQGGSDGSVTNNTVTDNAGAGIDLGTFQAPDNVVEHNTVTGNENGITAGSRAEVRHNHVTAPDGDGIEVQGASVVADNTIEDVEFVGIDAQGNTVIEFNTISDTPIGITSDRDGLEIHANEFSETEIDLLLDDATDAIVTDNEFATGVGLANVPENLDEEPHEMSGNTVGGDPLVYVVNEDDPEIDPDAGQIILVDVENVDLDGYSFSDVTAGIQVTHAEDVTITDSEFTTISEAFTTPQTRNLGAVSTWHSASVTVDTFTITDSERGVYVADSDDVTISNGSITASDRNVIITADTTGELTIADNTITGSETTAISVGSAESLSVVGNDVTDANRGIDLLSADDAVIKDNVIDGTRFTGLRLAGSIGDLVVTNNTVTDGDNNAVMQPGGGTNTISGDVTVGENTITNNGGEGVSLRLRGDHVTFTDNVVSNNGEVGVNLDIDGVSLTVANNIIADNQGDIGFALEFDVTDGTVESNTVRNNEDGLVVTRQGWSPVEQITITENTIEENAGIGLTVDGDNLENFLVNQNSIAGNTDGLYYRPGDVYVLNATNNWWGATDGPSGGLIDNETREVADGSGDSIAIRDVWWLDDDSVQFDPWLEAPLVNTGTLSGQVTDADTTDTIAGATVEIRDGTTTVDTLETDANGNYDVTLAVGTYDVAANADEYSETVESDIEITADETTTRDVQLTSVGSGSITGTVVDRDADPIAEADVEIVEQEGVSGLSVVPDGFTTTVETDANGQFDVEAPSGVYQLTVTASGFDEEFEQDIAVNVGENTDIGTIELTQEDNLGTITGTVTRESSGDSVQGAIVRALDSGTTVATVAADTEGSYELELEPGTYTLEATEESGSGLPESGTVENVEVTDGETTVADLVLTVPEPEPEPEVESIELSISETTLTENGSLVPVVVTATFDNGTTEDVSNEATLESDNTAVVEIVDLFSLPNPAVSPKEPGTATVTATYGGETDSVEVTVEADEEPQPGPEPELEVLGASVTPTQLETGEEATIDATVENGGEADGELTVPLEVDGGAVETKTVTLDAGESADVTFTQTFESAGEFHISVGGVDAGTVTVIEDADADILIYGADVNQSSIALGETIRITGDLLNNGGPGTYDVGLNVDGERIDTTIVDVASGATPGAVEFEWTPTEADLPADEDEMNATITLNGFVVETVHIENQYSDISVVAASTSEMELIEGEETYVIGSIYQGGNIQGTEEIELTATHNETGVTHVVGSQEVTLSPGYYLLGAINITFEPDEAGTYDLELGERNAGTVEVEPAESDIQVIAASVSQLELIEGEETYVIGSVYQGGNIEGTEEIDLTATNQETGETEVISSQEVTLSPGYYLLGAINITFEPEEAGTYDLELGERNAGTVEVEPAESDIQVIAASTSEIELIEGEEAHVIGSVYQGGNVEGTEEIDLTATHQETGETHIFGSQEVTVSPGYYHLGAINITFEPEEAGTYDLELGERNAGTVEVEAAVSDIQVIAASVADVEILQTEETYVIGSIYQAGNTDGTEEIALNATHQETGETHTVDTVEAELSPGYYHLGAINITFKPEEAGTYDLELGDRNAGFVEVEPAESDIQVIAASASEVEVIEGEEVSVVGSLYNDGDVEGTETIELTATDNETGETHVLGSQEVTLSPGYYLLGAINITFEPDEPGYYDLELGDRDAGLIAVEEAITDITVVAASTADAALIEGEETYVIGSVYQGGNVEETEEISLTATHQETGETEVIGSQEVTLSPGYYLLGAINITFEPDEPGTYDLELGERNAGTVEVEPAESDIQVIAASTSEVELIEGEETYVIGSVYQGGNVEGTEEIDLTATHQETGETEVIGTQEVTLSPGYYLLGAINITFEPDEPGTYDL